MTDKLENMRVAVIASDGFEESELTEPVRALREAGAKVDVISLKTGEIQAFRHHDKSIKVKVDRRLEDVRSSDYDGLLLPGGALNADALRIEKPVKMFVQEMESAGRPIAAICHAPWILISAGLAGGRTLTSYRTIQDDIRNAGGNWVDREVVVDRNLVTSRQPGDLPAFNREMIRLFARRHQDVVQIGESA